MIVHELDAVEIQRAIVRHLHAADNEVNVVEVYVDDGKIVARARWDDVVNGKPLPYTWQQRVGMVLTIGLWEPKRSYHVEKRVEAKPVDALDDRRLIFANS